MGDRPGFRSFAAAVSVCGIATWGAVEGSRIVALRTVTSSLTKIPPMTILRIAQSVRFAAFGAN